MANDDQLEEGVEHRLLEEDGDLSTETPVNAQSRPSRRLTFLNGLSLVLGLQIGSGIFLAPAQVTRQVISPGVGVLVWIVAGCFVWTGACSYIELGTFIPRNGGIQEYLRYCYGEFMGALFSWIWVIIARASSMAVITAIFAEYIYKAFFPNLIPPSLVLKVIGLGGLWLITLLNWTGQRAGANLANKFLVVKIGALVAIAISGITSGALGFGNGTATSPLGWFGTDPSTVVPPLSAQIANFVTAMFAALFCYNGFESVGFVLGDIPAPSKNLPIILHTAMTVVLVGFALTNISLYMEISVDELKSTDTPTITFANAIFGRVGGFIFSIIVAISALGALNANLFAIATLSVTASHQGYFPKFVGNIHCSSRSEEEEVVEKFRQSVGQRLTLPLATLISVTARQRWEEHVPVFATAVLAILISAYFILGTFDSLLTFTGISQYLFHMLAVTGIFVIRRQGLDSTESQPRYRTAIWNPVIFIACSCFVVVRGVLSNIAQGIAILVLALVVFIGYQARSKSRTAVEASSTQSSTSVDLGHEALVR